MTFTRNTSSSVPEAPQKKRILWFTDTIIDLNGVAVTLKNIGWLAHKRGDEIYIVSSLGEHELNDSLPPNYINLKPLLNFRMPFYPTLSIRVPSFFGTLRLLKRYNANAVFISSVSVVGFYGLMFSKLFKIESTAIFHTDLAAQTTRIVGAKHPVTRFLEVYSRWLHEEADNLLVPTEEYKKILAPRGFNTARMGIFQRGLDTTVFYPVENAAEIFSQKYNVPEGINLVYTGRISDDKNLDFLIEAARPVMERHPEINLVLAGMGPDLERMKTQYAADARIHFIGNISNRDLPVVYSAAKMLVFPSETDTFGMSVLESQACGIPALVSHIGGPRNIVRDGETGYVINTDAANLWTQKIEELVHWIKTSDPRYSTLCSAAVRHVKQNYDFERIIDQFVAPENLKEETLAEKVG
jgi:glycosyltransferase involved in cell wall biosynthesis